MLLTSAIDAYLAGRRGLISSKTATNYRFSLSVLIADLGDVEIETVTLDRLREYRAHLFSRGERYPTGAPRPRKSGGLSTWTINTHIRITRQFFRWLVDERLLPASPASRLEIPVLGDEPPKGIAEEDLVRMFAVARTNARDLALLLFLADTGCRVGGAVGLTLADLDLEHRSALVHEKGHRGRQKIRRVFFNPPTATALEQWLLERSRLPQSRACDRVFLGHKGALTGNGIYQIVERIGRDAGVGGRCNPHSFRHGLARALLQRGLDMGRVSKILGHSDIRVTSKFYGMFSQAEVQEAHDRFSWIKDLP